MNNNKPKTESEIIKTYLWGSIIIAIILGVVMIAMISGYSVSIATKYFSAFGCGILIAGASLSSGGFLGFIFGIPSMSQTPTAKLKYNDNLVQISDWLTKIIVGVGLTQLYNIPRFIRKIGEQFQINFGGGNWAINVSIAIMSYFFVLGFLMIYFWTKTDYSTIMKNMDDDLNKQLADTEKKLDEEIKAKEQAQEEKKSMATEIVQRDLQSKITEATIADKNGNFVLQNDGSNSRANFEELKGIVNELLPSKKIIVTDDLQKNRWGAKSENGGKRINAKVTKNNWQNLFDVYISITNVDNTPLIDPVAIFIHDSYQVPDNVIYVSPTDGKAQLTLLASKAFTLGVLFTDKTELELDLNDQLGFPPEFYWKKI